MKTNLKEGYNRGDLSKKIQSVPQKFEEVVPKRDTYEVFRYKVVYPGGIYLRISPAVDAKKTGIILEYGTIFDASKSVFLDGIVYVKVLDGDGWVFESTNGVQILELQFIIRVPYKKNSTIKSEKSEKSVSLANTNGLVASTTNVSITTPVDHSMSRNIAPTQSYRSESELDSTERLNSDIISPSLLPTNKFKSNPFGPSSDLSINGSPLPMQRQQARVENRLWRDIRARCGACESFEDFLNLTSALDMSLFSSQSQHDYRVLGCVNLIASITSQCSSHVMTQQTQSRFKGMNMGVAMCLWVLVHMGSRVAHTMHLIVEAANIKFETVSSGRQAQLLRVVLEVGTRTKSHAADLGKQVDILPDDIRNFLQRWVIVQSLEEEKEARISDDDNGASDAIDRGDNRKEESQQIEEAHKNDYEVQKTPLSEPIRCIRSPSKWSLSLPTQLSTWLSGSDARNTPYDVGLRSNSNNYNSSSQLDFTSSKERGAGVSVSGLNEDSKESEEPLTLSRIMWREMEKQIKKLADPDMQLAGLI